ncbi:hypothetical protein JXO52_04880 [bacterium]|nr:hypothetical protein [bacterium]
MIDLNIAHRGVWLWILAFVITVASAVYQRMTGPTYPVSGTAVIGGFEQPYEFLTTEEVGTDLEVTLTAPDTAVHAWVEYRRFKSHDEWQRADLVRNGDNLAAVLPQQPSAGKLMYTVYMTRGGGPAVSLTDAPVIARYKGAVPGWVLLPHILIMFAAMLVANRTGLEALDSRGRYKRKMVLTIALMFIGGFILGPIMQKFAFGAWWTGFPLGTDLTDNKTLIAMLFWLWAWFKNRKNRSSRLWICVAALVTLVIFLIPHSLLGSELDYTQ